MTDQAKFRALALALLANGEGINRRSGQFLGQLCAPDHYPLTPKQFDWLGKLAERGGMADEFSGIDHAE